MTQVIQHIKLHNILADKQHGFHKKHSFERQNKVLC